MSIGDRLREERHRLGLGQAEFGTLAGVAKTTQFNYEAGGRSPDADYFAAADKMGVDVLFVLTGRRASGATDPHVLVPRLTPQAVSGHAANDGASEADIEGLSFSKVWLLRRGLQAHNLCVVDVVGDSMKGKLESGDKVLVDRGSTIPKSGFAYVLRQDNELLIKYCQLLPDGVLRLSSENSQSFPPYDVNLMRSTDISILGRVVASMHEW